jgi:hypothetical protein
MSSEDERGAGLSGALCNACWDGDRFASLVSIFLCIALDSRGEEDDRGVNGLGGGDGSRQLVVDEDSCSTTASECELQSCRRPGWDLNEIDYQHYVEENNM